MGERRIRVRPSVASRREPPRVRAGACGCPRVTWPCDRWSIRAWRGVWTSRTRRRIRPSCSAPPPSPRSRQVSARGTPTRSERRRRGVPSLRSSYEGDVSGLFWTSTVGSASAAPGYRRPPLAGHEMSVPASSTAPRAAQGVPPRHVADPESRRPRTSVGVAHEAELVANVVDHVGCEITVRAYTKPGWLRVEVDDGQHRCTRGATAGSVDAEGERDAPRRRIGDPMGRRGASGRQDRLVRARRHDRNTGSTLEVRAPDRGATVPHTHPLNSSLISSRHARMRW